MLASLVWRVSIAEGLGVSYISYRPEKKIVTRINREALESILHRRREIWYSTVKLAHM